MLLGLAGTAAAPRRRLQSEEGCAETEDGRCVCSDREGNTFDTSKLGPRPAGGFFTFGPALLPWVEYKLVFGFCAAVPLPENCCRPADGCDPSSPTLAYRMDEDRSPDHPRDSNCEYFSDGGSMHVSVQRIDPEPGHTPERSGGVAMKWECVRPSLARAYLQRRNPLSCGARPRRYDRHRLDYRSMTLQLLCDGRNATAPDNLTAL